MKRQISKGVRICLIIGLVGVLLPSLYFLSKPLIWPQSTTTKVPLVSYKQQASVNYRAYLLPNNLYPQSTIEAGKVYISSFVDYINTFLTYDFKADQANGVKGSYEAKAVVEGVTKEGKRLWQREFPLMPSTPFVGQGATASLSQELPIKYTDYNTFAKKVIDESKFSPDDVRLTIRWNITVEAETEKGLIREQLSPTMVIPLGRAYFEITGDLKPSKTGALEEVHETTVQATWKTWLPFGSLSVICLMSLLFVLLRTENAKKVEPLQQKINHIFKAHGDRLVALDRDIDSTDKQMVPVMTMEDLVRIADELGRPVVYRGTASDGNELPRFYVLDDPQVYVYRVKRSLVSQPPTKPGSRHRLTITGNSTETGSS